MPGAVDVSEIRKEGWIQKESAVIRTFRRRWMVLTPEKLYSFKGEKKYVDPTEVREESPHAHQHLPSTTPAESPVGRSPPSPQEIDLRQCGTVKSADDLTNRLYSFTGVLLPALRCTMHHTMERSTPLCQPGPTIHRAVQVPDRNYFLIAANEAERNEWVAGIGARLRALRVPRPVARLGVSVARALAGRVQAWCPRCLPSSQAGPPPRVGGCAATRRRCAPKSTCAPTTHPPGTLPA